MESSDLNSTNKTDDVVAYKVLDDSENTQPEDNSENWNWDFGSTDAVDTVDENLIIGNNQSIMGDDTTYEQFTSEAKTDVFNKVDSIFDKLREKFPLDESDGESDKEKPFSDGKNPFGEGQFPLPPGYEGENSSSEAEVNDNTTGENPFAGGAGGGENPFAGGAGGGENPFAGGAGGGENPFAGGEDAVAGQDGMSSESSFDVTSFMLGDSLSFMNGGAEGGTENSGMPSSSPSESLRKVYDTLTRFASDTTYPGFAMGNETPLKTSNDLLTLFRNDMFSNNSSNSFEQLMGEDSPFGDEDNSLSADGKIEENLDIIEAALDGLLPFNGTESVFSTPEGEIPLGNGNIDDGSDNAVIGNANRDYGNFNATIGNGNWNWDGATKNSTVGNGNWHLDFSDNNNTLGNGNWHWEDSDNNSTLGNGNWAFGDNNSTIGNGNFNFGNNNTVIGNGNWVYTDNSIVIGNGNWSVVIDKSAAGADEFLDDFNATMSYGAGVKNATDSLVDSMLGKMAGMFMPLTEDFGESAMNTYNELFDSSSSGMDFPI
ncbi:MAG: hypothetical protein WBA39_30260 [Rivularia sp. (in: cyanobacteria)]